MSTKKQEYYSQPGVIESEEIVAVIIEAYKAGWYGSLDMAEEESLKIYENFIRKQMKDSAGGEQMSEEISKVIKKLSGAEAPEPADPAE